MTDAQVIPAPTLGRAFLTFWSGVALTAIADGLAFVALPFIVLGARLDMPGETALGLVVLAGSLPRFFAPFMGALVDRWPLKAALAATGVLRALVVLGIAALAAGGRLSLALVMTANALNGLLSIFAYTAASVTVPTLVPRASLARANGLMTAATMGLPLVGYGLAGALVASRGPAFTVAVAATGGLSLCASVLLTSFPARDTATSTGIVRDLLEGLRLLAADGQLLVLGVLSLLLNATLATVNVLAPTIMVRLGRGAAGYGLFESLISGAALAGIALVAVLGPRLNGRLGITLGNLTLLAGIALITPATYPAMLGSAVLSGLGLGVLEVTSITLLQQIVPDNLRGRLLGASMGFGALGLTLGSSLAATLAPRAPLAAFTIGLTLITLAPTIVWAVKYRREPVTA